MARSPAELITRDFVESRDAKRPHRNKHDEEMSDE
jgi:hypothetical protein